jgi:hypothetical protein
LRESDKALRIASTRSTSPPTGPRPVGARCVEPLNLVSTYDRQLSQLAQTIPVVRKSEMGLAEEDDSEDLANRYEFLVLYGVSVPADLDQKLREAHRRIHLRGLDPLRRPA